MEQLAPIQAMYDDGRFLAAHAAGEAVGPLARWRGVEGRILAGRLAANLGAQRLARILHLLAFREHPESPETNYYGARSILELRGPLPAWEFLTRRGDLPDATPIVRAEWFSFRAQVAGFLRDFETAERWLTCAERIAPDHTWLMIERSNLFEQQDRYDEAIDVALRTLERRPWYRPAVQQAAELFQLRGRDHEALELLREATTHIESGWVLSQLATLETELGFYQEARQHWEQVPHYLPLRDESVDRWLVAHMSDAAYDCGDLPRAAGLAKEAGNPFHKKIAERLAAVTGEPGHRKLLPVTFVRQHHLTCGPATLSAICRFWSIPADHLALAEAICYDGTPADSERSWAQLNGFVAREFAVDWTSACALIDRGVPFTLTTIEPTSGHLQAVIGYDPVRGTLLIRDPYHRQVREFLAEETFARYRSTGPRGMAMVPAAQSHLLDEIDLPQAWLYDLLHLVQRALTHHDRPRALEVFHEMEGRAPGHRLTLWARRSIAAYDSDTVESLQCIEELLVLYPDDANLNLGKISCLRALGRREELLALLNRICADKKSDPVFWEHYAHELKQDAREHRRAIRLVRRALRLRPREAGLYSMLADLLWQVRRVPEAVQLYRFAACIEDKDERLARSWFVASRHLKQTDEVLRQMRDKVARFGRRSGQPARTLFWAYEQIHKAAEGFAVLEAAVRDRPDDGDLLLFAANAYARFARYEKAEQLLTAAKGKSRRTNWLRAAADIATYRGNRADALSALSEVVEVEPLAIDVHAHLARLLADSQGRVVAVAHLQKVVNQFLYNQPLHQLLIQWLRENGPVEVCAASRRLIEIHPTDAWSRRELIGALLELGRVDEAALEADVTLRLDPASPSSHYYAACVLLRQDRLADAQAALRRAIEISIDADFAIGRLIENCTTPAERIEELAFVHRELVRQTIFGDGLLAYRFHASGTLEPEQLLTSLREALAARPDLWHAWSSVVSQLSEMGRGEEACSLAREATERFPLLPRTWVDLARACQVVADTTGEADALVKALELSPNWTEASRKLADFFVRSGDLEAARERLLQATVAAPLDGGVHADLAEVLWKLSRRSEAVERMQLALRLDNSQDWAWRALSGWAEELPAPADGSEPPDAQLARELTVQRPSLARSWFLLARVLSGEKYLEERLAALGKAIQLDPKMIDACDLRAWLLATAGRHDEASDVCNDPRWNGKPPLKLRARAAWIQSQRGDIQAAITAMRAVLDEDPKYYWAWTRLADWIRQDRSADAEYLTVTQAIHRQWPLNHISMGYLGEARFRNGDRAGAREIWAAAIRRQPDYAYAAESLFEVALEDGDLDEAEAALTLLRRQPVTTSLTLRSLRLLAKRGRQSEAMEELARLFGVKELEPSDLDSAIQHVVDAGWREELVALLKTEAATPEPRVAMVVKLIEQLAAAKWWYDCGRTVNRFLEGRRRHRLGIRWRRTKAVISPEVDALQEPVALAYLSAVAKAPTPTDLLEFISRYRPWLRSKTSLWAKVGYALKVQRRYRQGASWNRDWRNRPDLEAWALVNVGQTLRALGRDREAGDAHARGASMECPPRIRTIHHLWLAFDAIMAGRVEAATASVEKTDLRSVGDIHRLLHGMVDAVLTVRQRASLFETNASRQNVALNKLADAARLSPQFRMESEYRRAYRCALRRIVFARPMPKALTLWCKECVSGRR